MSIIRLTQGGGGEATANLIKEVFWSRLNNFELQKGNDAAILRYNGGNLAFTTDSFVITPWKFPGGDIGKLAVCGTINDLAVMGATPLGIAISFIIEEGFALADLETIAQSLAETAQAAGVAVVTGDTKVVNQGAADGIFITTSGVGTVAEGIKLGGEMAQPGDQVLVTGTLGDHGAAVLLARGEWGLSSELQSDVAPLNGLLLPLVEEFGNKIRVMRDPTRGGLATTLNEIAQQSKVAIRLQEEALPIRPEVRGLAELLGLDPLYLANEGKALIVVAPEVAIPILESLQKTSLGENAAIIGVLEAEHPGLVSLRTRSGGERILPLGSGEHLPRIC